MKLILLVSSLMVTLGFADDIKAALNVTESELATHLLQLEGRKQSEESEAQSGGLIKNQDDYFIRPPAVWASNFQVP